MDHSTSTENARPWWDEVAHLRGVDDRLAPAERPDGRRGELLRSPVAAWEESPPPRHAGDAIAGLRGEERDDRLADHVRHRPAGRSRRREAGHAAGDWFADEARVAGRRTTPRRDPMEVQRPRVTLVDVSPDHALVRRAPQVRRAPGERPTVTITGRPDAALPPQVREPAPLRARRTREQASSLVASPDRMILWAVALGLLMILASIGTATADAATTLTLLP